MEKPNFYQIESFGNPGCPLTLNGSFDQNIRKLMNGELLDVTEGITSRLLFLVKNGVSVPLYIMEEKVENCKKPFCNHCIYSGWSHHFVAKVRYRFIIPVEKEWHVPSKFRGFEDKPLILHGLIHCNGVGHLISINGLETGSRSVCGRDIMDLWDRMCRLLAVRKIGVRDTSRKRSVDVRFLYGLAYGKSWFSMWGYEFHHGSFGENLEKYKAALVALSSLTLDQVLGYFADPEGSSIGRRIKKTIDLYQSVSNDRLITIGDFFRFLLILNTKTPEEIKFLTPIDEEAVLGMKRNQNPGEDVYKDIGYLYTHLFQNCRNSDLLENIQTILDTKNFVKEWPVKLETDDLLRFVCIVPPVSNESETLLKPPGEVMLVLQPSATITDLMNSAQRVLRETFFATHQFMIKGLKDADDNFYSFDDDKTVSSSIEQGRSIWIHGDGIDLGAKLIYERGVKIWKVDCACGAKDDDGEELVFCDTCKVWKHIRCVNYVKKPNSDSDNYSCPVCSSS